MKILMLLSKEFSTDPRVTREALALQEVGHQVTVIFWDRNNDFDSSHVAKNEKYFEYVHKGIKIIGLHDGFLRKLVPSVTIKNPFWWRQAYRFSLRHYEFSKFDVVHCHDLDTLQIGVWLKKKLGIKLVYDAHEIFSLMIKGHVPNMVVKYASYMEKKLLKYVDGLITVNMPLKQFYQDLTLKPVHIVMNCKDPIVTDYQSPSNENFTLFYAGVLNESRMFPEIVDMIGGLNGIDFIIAGKKEGLYEEVKDRCKKYDNIMFLGTVSQADIQKCTLLSDAIICLFNPEEELNKMGLPNKVFEAMASGRPIIVTKGLYYSDFVEKEECGVSIKRNNLWDLFMMIKYLKGKPKLCENLGRNGLKSARMKYNWKNESKKLNAIYEAL